MRRIHYTALLLILITSCQSSPREGLKDSDRNYVYELPKIRCLDSESYSDFLFELNSLEYDNITKESKLLSDSILGVDFLDAKELQNVNEKLKNHYFSFEQEIANMRLVIGSQNLWDLEDGNAELTNDSIIPRNLNWKKLVCENDPLEVNIEKGDLKIQFGFFHCVGKSKKQIGQFEKIINHGNSLEQIPVYGYEIDLDFIINLNITNTKLNKYENYQKALNDSCIGFSIGDFGVMQFLAGDIEYDSIENQEKKITIMKERK